MQTKLKNKKEFDVNNNLLENTNFRNNQNYILGKTEKKKLLSKFFVEKFKNKIFIFLNKMDYFFEKNNLNNIIVFYSFSAFGFLFLIFVAIWPPLFYLLFFGFFFFLLKVLVLELPSFYKFSIISFKDYFFDRREKSLSIKFLFFLIGLSIITIIPFGIITFLGNIFPDYEVLFMHIFLLILAPVALYFFYYHFVKKNQHSLIFKLKIFNLLILPILGLILLIYFLLSFITTFVYKREKGFLFFKSSIKIDYLRSLDFISNDYAENEHYKIIKL